MGSGAIRKAIEEGKIYHASALLGRAYTVAGYVRRGDARGGQIGFPTANIQPPNVIIPREGVYATRTLVDGRSFLSVTNIGTRPTFGLGEQTIETHILRFPSENLYGKRIQVAFESYIRGEQRFSSIEELKLQIARDIEERLRLAGTD